MKTCLIVDDSKVVRMVARKILEGLNFEIAEAEPTPETGYRLPILPQAPPSSAS